MKKNIFIVLGIILIAVLLERTLANFALLEKLELASYDLRSSLSEKYGIFKGNFRHSDKDIVIIALDNYSKRQLLLHPRKDLGPWPWHRDAWNEIINYVEGGQPKAVMFDMVFENLSENPQHDINFAQGLRKYDNIIIGTYLDSPKTKDNPFTKKIEIDSNENIPTNKSLDVTIDNSNLENAITYFINAPVDDIYTKNNTVAVLNKPIDDDFNVRKAQPIYKLIKGGKTYYMPSLAFAGFMKYMGEESNITINNNKIYYKDRVIPIDDEGLVDVNRAGRNYTYIPISKILLNKTDKHPVKPEFFKDKLIIFGKTAAGSKIDFSSIIDPAYTSPEANAIALDSYINDTIPNAKSKNFISELPKPVEFLITVLLCLLVGVLGWYSKSALIGFINGFLSIMLYVVFCFWLFANPSSRVWLPIVVPLYYLTLTSGIVFAFKFHKEVNKKTSIMNVFGKFVSPKVINNVIKNSDMQLKNTRKRITVLFCDVKNFSHISEKYEPEKLVNNLNELFKEIVNIIFENNGTVDKFIGDCIMAYWGDLADSEDDEYMAVKTALEIKKKVNELKIKNAKEDKIIFDVKIGINTGEAILGLTGTEKIMSYTAMGDAVNIASRLESSCSKLNKDILISKPTYEQTKDKIVALELGKIKVKGKEEEIEVFEPIGLTEEENEFQKAVYD